MNSIAIVNWEDKEFRERVTYALTKARYVLTEDYESIGVRTSVWEKPSNVNQVGRVIENDPLAPLRLLPAEAIAARIIDRLETLMPAGTERHWLEWAATNLAFDLMGKPG
jgi:hypothetical protein